MATTQKFLIAGGVFIVVVIVAIAAFSLGVYVGERGWTAGPPSMTGPGGSPKGPVLVVRLLASRASSRQVASRGSHREEALVSYSSARQVICPPASRM